jgi:hypothetical protein
MSYSHKQVLLQPPEFGRAKEEMPPKSLGNEFRGGRYTDINKFLQAALTCFQKDC